MAKEEYPELKETQKFAEAMGAKTEVRFYETDTPGIYDVDVTVGGVTPIGPMYFSFDKKRIFNFWPDYPDKLTTEQIKLFNKHNPVLARLKGYGGFPPEDESNSE